MLCGAKHWEVHENMTTRSYNIEHRMNNLEPYSEHVVNYPTIGDTGNCVFAHETPQLMLNRRQKLELVLMYHV